MTTRPSLSRAVLILALLWIAPLSGCAVITGFNRDWRETLNEGCCDDLSGCWEGEWHSCPTGHHGTLKAVITRCGCSNVYDARFHATFLKVIPFEYSIPLTTVVEDGVTHFRGSARLPKIAGGTYRTTGTADGCRFHARYCADKDHGTFTLTRRVGCSGGCCHRGCASQECTHSCTE
jgi:hypothetical protein